jgi:hypothetical protein
MKKKILVLLCVVNNMFSHAQHIIDLGLGRVDNKIESTVPIRDVEKISNGYIITYTFDKAMILPDDVFSGTVFWKIDGFGMSKTSGVPCTLARNDLIAIPFGYSAKVEVIDSVFNDYKYELTPARQPLLNSNNEIYTKKNVTAIKPYEGFKPTSVAEISEIQHYRGYGICQTTVCPIQYNYGTKTIRAYTTIKYKVTFTPNTTDEMPRKTKPMQLSYEDHFLSNNVIGFELSELLNNKTTSTVQSDVRDYLILSTSTYSTAANRFAEWKRLLGFNVHVVLRDDWTSSSVKSTVTNAYTNMEALYYLLIIGDHSDVPAEQASLIRTHITDFHYGCIDNDYVPEIYCGRLSVSNSNEAINVVEKIINYEQTPPTSSAFYNKGLHCAYFQDDDNDNYADRRFAQTSEDVRTYVMSQNKSLQRVYKTPLSVTPLYWNKTIYSNGESIPNELKKPAFAWDGDSDSISSAINCGVFYVLHRDHGTVWGWGNPRYTQQNIDSLSNGSLLPVVFSMNCLTGKFDENCFAETFLRKTNGGCVGIYGATQISYSGYNEALTTGMFDAIWPDPGLCINLPNHNNTFSTTPSPTYTLGQILGQGMVRLAETYGPNDSYTKYTKELFHCFGDPSMKIYTQKPTAFTGVSVVRNSNSISVNLGVNDTARITAYNPISCEVKSFLGNSATITISNPYETIICVSGHNRIPFIQHPDVMYIQNTNITGTLSETHDVIKVGNHVTETMDSGDVTTSGANITLRAREVLLDSGTHISAGSTLNINP